MQFDNSGVDLDIRHLKMLEAIAEEGTMTSAGKRLHLSQSALSHQLAGLEDGLGVSLFRRVPRGMYLTAAGERLLVRGKTILRELRQAREELEDSSGMERGPLRISTECYTCYHWLPSRIKEFQADFPHVEVRIVVEATHQPVQALLANKLDLAIVSERPRHATLKVRELFEDELVAIVNPQHPLVGRPYLKAADFAGEHLLTYAVPTSDLTVFQEFLTPAGIAPARVSKVDLTEAIIEMVKAGLGIAVMARWAVARHLNASSLKALRLTAKGFRRKWYAVTLRSKCPARYVEEFVKLLGSGSTGIPACVGFGG
jgi:LysR family transcriptional regulator for metE and metH